MSSSCQEVLRQNSAHITEMFTLVDNFIRSEKACRDTELPKGEGPDQIRRGYTGPKVDRVVKGSYGGKPRDDRRGDQRRRDLFQPYVSPRNNFSRNDNRNDSHRNEFPRFHNDRPGIESLVKPPREILATERHLNLPQPPPMVGRPRAENIDRFCEYHGEKGHLTNDCHQLKKELEVALKSGKLDHLLKDWRQRDAEGNREQRRRDDKGKAKVINMIRSSSVSRKRGYGGIEEESMKVPIVFPSIATGDFSEEPLIIEGNIEGYLVRRIYVDEGSSVNVMYEHCFRNLSHSIRKKLEETSTSLVGFSGETNKPLGKIELEVKFGDNGLFRKTMMKFYMVRSPSSYNVIL